MSLFLFSTANILYLIIKIITILQKSKEDLKAEKRNKKPFCCHSINFWFLLADMSLLPSIWYSFHCRANLLLFSRRSLQSPTIISFSSFLLFIPILVYVTHKSMAVTASERYLAKRFPSEEHIETLCFTTFLLSWTAMKFLSIFSFNINWF